MFNFFNKNSELENSVYQKMKRILNVPIHCGYLESHPLEGFKYASNSKELSYQFDDKWWVIHRRAGTIVRTMTCYGHPYTMYDQSLNKPEILLTSGESMIKFYVPPYDYSIMIDTENVSYTAVKLRELLDSLYTDMNNLADYHNKLMYAKQLELKNEEARKEFEQSLKDISARALGAEVCALYHLY